MQLNLEINYDRIIGAFGKYTVFKARKDQCLFLKSFY
jgi:hypothetical protein